MRAIFRRLRYRRRMSPRSLVWLCVAACYASPADVTTTTAPTGASAADTAADTSEATGASADASSSSVSPTGDDGADPTGSAAATTLEIGSTSSDATTSPPATSGPMEGCGDVDYTGYCDGDVLVWCEEEMLKMVDCAADGRVCVFESDRVGFNCVVPQGVGGFGYPVGDRSTSPAGGWTVTQVLAHYYDAYGGGHLAHDVAVGEAETANAPVYSVADGVVRYAGANASSYVNVVLIEHEYDGGQRICSFYGHLNAPSVATGQVVARGDQVATILDQSGNSHLHYVMLAMNLCDASANAGGALVCGYDGTAGFNGVTDLSNEPAVYTALANVCANQNYPDAFLSPTKFIDAHHF